MSKRVYETPVADMLTFDYKNTVVASGGSNPAHCGPQSWGQCKDQYLQKPADCYGNDASHCVTT